MNQEILNRDVITCANSSVICSPSPKSTLIKVKSKFKAFRACLTARDGGPSETEYKVSGILKIN